MAVEESQVRSGKENSTLKSSGRSKLAEGQVGVEMRLVAVAVRQDEAPSSRRHPKPVNSSRPDIII